MTLAAPDTRVAFYAALATTQVAMCLGTVYLKHSLANGRPPHPVVFALCREVGSGILLITGSTWWYRVSPRDVSRGDVLTLFGMGFGLFCNQLMYILGLKMAGVLVATCMQPSIPIFTVALAMAFGQERRSCQKLAGILLAAVGSATMVFGTATRLPDTSRKSLPIGENPLAGALCLVGNCFAMACYFILSRRVASKYPPICLTGWAYGTAAMWMSVTAVFTVDRADWTLPPGAYGPLVYWILITSVVGYCVMTMSTKYLPASQVSAFICLQPLIGSVMAVTMLGETTDWWDLGGLGVLAGLACVLHDQQPTGQSHAAVRLSSRGDFAAVPSDDRAVPHLSREGELTTGLVSVVGSFQGSFAGSDTVRGGSDQGSQKSEHGRGLGRTKLLEFSGPSVEQSSSLVAARVLDKAE